MKKILAIGSLLLTSAAVVTMPALASDRDDYARSHDYAYQARLERQRREERVERERRDHQRRDVRDVRDFHSYPDRRW